MKNGFAQEGSAAIMHALMLGSSEGDKVVLAAATPEALKRAFDNLVGGQYKPDEVQRVAVCDADLAGLMQMEARNG